VNKCKICKIPISKWSILGYCKSCSNKFAHKREITKHYCINCKINEISITNFLYGKQRCRVCSKPKINPMFGKKRPDLILRNIKNRKHPINHCVDCKKIIAIQYTRCEKCWRKFAVGKNHPCFGKIASHGKWSKYKNTRMRSSWEIKYAKYLDNQKVKWFYEPKAFDLGNTTYTPDFYLPETNEYIEIKGYWRDDAKIKFELFKQIYSKIKITILMKKELKKLKII